MTRLCRAVTRLRNRPAGEEGLSLAEVLIAVTILGIGVVGIATALAALPTASDYNRKQVSVDMVIRNYAEAIKEKVRTGANGGYPACAPGESGAAVAAKYAATPAMIGWEPPQGYTAVPNGDKVQFQNSSNLNLVLVIDRSGSVYPDRDEIKTAANAFLGALANTGTSVSIVSFGTTASVNADVTPVTTANLAGLQAVIGAPGNETVATNGIAFIPPGDGAGTNWDDGLVKTLGQIGRFPPGPPPMVVFITDGNPTYYIDADGDVDGPGNSTNTATLNAAIEQADIIKDGVGSHLFALGVQVDGGLNEANLRRISGDVEFDPDDPESSFSESDWMLVDGFNALAQALTDIAEDLHVETYSSECPPAGDQGSQRLTLTASSVDGRATETLEVIVRQP